MSDFYFGYKNNVYDKFVNDVNNLISNSYLDRIDILRMKLVKLLEFYKKNKEVSSYNIKEITSKYGIINVTILDETYNLEYIVKN